MSGGGGGLYDPVDLETDPTLAEMGTGRSNGFLQAMRRRCNLIMGIVIAVVVLFVLVLVVWAVISWFRRGGDPRDDEIIGPGDCRRSLYVIGHNGSFDTLDAEIALQNEMQLLYGLDRFHIEFVPRLLPGDPPVSGSNCVALTAYVTSTLTPAVHQLDTLVRSALHHEYQSIVLPSQSTLLERFLAGRFVYPASCALPDVLFFSAQPLFSDRYQGVNGRTRFFVLDTLAPTVAALPAATRLLRFADVGTTQDATLVKQTLTQLGIVAGNSAHQVVFATQGGDYDSTQAVANFKQAALAAGYTVPQLGVWVTINLVDATTFSLADLTAADGEVAAVVASKTRTVIVVAADNSLWPEVAQQWGTTLFNLDTIKTAVLGLRFAPSTSGAEVSTPVYTGCVPLQRVPSRDTVIILGASTNNAATFETTIAPFNAYLMEAVKWASVCYTDRATMEHVETSVFGQPLVFEAHEEVAYLLQCGVYPANEKTLESPLLNIQLNGRWFGEVAVP
jgi:hypothetical protein